MKCKRCSGHGHIPAFKHIRNGVCFRCWGTGDDLPSAIEALEKALQEKRGEYRSAQKAGQSVEGIVREGLALRQKVNRLRLQVQVLSASTKEGAA